MSKQAVVAVANQLAVEMASDCSGGNDEQSAATASQQQLLRGTEILHAHFNANLEILSYCYR